MDTPTGTGDPAALLDRWKTITRTATAGPWEAHSHLRQYSIWHDELDEPLAREVRNWDDAVLMSAARTAMPLLVGAVDAVLDLADDLTGKSEALDAEAEYVAGEHPEAAAVAVLKRERSIAYDECARWFREAIRTALTGGDDVDAGNPLGGEAATRRDGKR